MTPSPHTLRSSIQRFTQQMLAKWLLRAISGPWYISEPLRTLITVWILNSCLQKIDTMISELFPIWSELWLIIIFYSTNREVEGKHSSEGKAEAINSTVPKGPHVIQENEERYWFWGRLGTQAASKGQPWFNSNQFLPFLAFFKKKHINKIQLFMWSLYCSSLGSKWKFITNTEQAKQNRAPEQLVMSLPFSFFSEA